MGLAVVTVASGGLPVVDVSAIAPRSGLPVTEAANGRGIAVTKVVGKPGLPVVYVTESGAALATFNGTATNVILSNGNRTATHSNTTTDSGARSASSKNAGKYYWEVTIGQSSGNTDCAGCLLTGDSFSQYPAGSGGGMVVFRSNGQVWSNFGNSGVSFGAISNGAILSFAVDTGVHVGWVRVNGGNWNANASYNPATATGGVLMGGGTPSYEPGVIFAGAGTASGDNFTGNFGQSAFVYTPPSGFGNWPA